MMVVQVFCFWRVAGNLLLYSGMIPSSSIDFVVFGLVECCGRKQCKRFQNVIWTLCVADCIAKRNQLVLKKSIPHGPMSTSTTSRSCRLCFNRSPSYLGLDMRVRTRPVPKGWEPWQLSHALYSIRVQGTPHNPHIKSKPMFYDPRMHAVISIKIVCWNL